MGSCLSMCGDDKDKKTDDNEQQGQDRGLKGGNKNSNNKNQSEPLPDANNKKKPNANDRDTFPSLGGGDPVGPKTIAHHHNHHGDKSKAAAAAQAPAPHTKPLVSLKQVAGNTVRNVYDGDTLTCDNEERVRLVGIDAPEIKAHEEFATESKALLVNLCPKRCEIILEVDPANEKDHYGRTIARVFVKDTSGKYGGGLVSANDVMLHSGLATFYDPKNSSMGAELRAHMLALQSDAMRKRVGIWRDFEDSTVFKTINGGAFHSRGCEHIKDIRNVDELRKSEALGLGLNSCRTCHA